MRPEEVTEQVGARYLDLMRLENPGAGAHREFFEALLPVVPAETLKDLVGPNSDWRDHLVVLQLMVMKGSSTELPQLVLESLAERPSGQLVHMFAALVVALPDGPSEQMLDVISQLAPDLFDGEMGWARAQFLYHTGVDRTDIPADTGPYSGVSFHMLLEHYRLMRGT